MNMVLVKALIAFIPASLILIHPLVLFVRQKTPAHLIELIGGGGFMVVVLTHIAEALRWFPAMGWGERHSAGHYLDLAGAVVAVTLLPLGWLLNAMEKRRS